MAVFAALIFVSCENKQTNIEEQNKETSVVTNIHYE